MEKAQVIIPNLVRVKPEPSFHVLERSISPDLWTHDVDSPSPPPPDPAEGSDEDTGIIDLNQQPGLVTNSILFC